MPFCFLTTLPRGSHGASSTLRLKSAMPTVSIVHVDAGRARAAEELEGQRARGDGRVDDHREIVGVLQLEVDDGVDDGGVEAHPQVAARARVVAALHHLQAGEVARRRGACPRPGRCRRRCPRASRPCRSPARVKKPFSSLRGADVGVERDDLARHDHHALHLGGGAGDVLGTVALRALEAEARLVARQHRRGVDGRHHRRRCRRGGLALGQGDDQLGLRRHRPAPAQRRARPGRRRRPGSGRVARRMPCGSPGRGARREPACPARP